MSMVRGGEGIETLTYPCINILEGRGSGRRRAHRANLAWKERLRAYFAAKDFLDLTSFTSCGVKKMTSLVTPPLFGL